MTSELLERPRWTGQRTVACSWPRGFGPRGLAPNLATALAYAADVGAAVSGRQPLTAFPPAAAADTASRRRRDRRRRWRLRRRRGPAPGARGRLAAGRRGNVAFECAAGGAVAPSPSPARAPSRAAGACAPRRDSQRTARAGQRRAARARAAVAPPATLPAPAR